MKTRLLILITFLATAMLHAQEVPVTASELPAEAKAFLKEHFKSPFDHGMKDVDNRTIIYNVILEDETSIEFAESGSWIEVDGKGNAVPISFIQQDMLEYIKVNYPGVAISSVRRGDTKYETSLSNGIDLKFNAQGNFVKVE